MPKKKLTAAATAPKVDESGLDLARQCVWAAQEKKALDPIILDLHGISSITDYLVICSAQSEPQIKAIANGVEQTLKEGSGRHPLAVDGFPTSQWIVIDYQEVIDLSSISSALPLKMALNRMLIINMSVMVTS